MITNVTKATNNERQQKEHRNSCSVRPQIYLKFLYCP